jgi:CubicO group peptidase (beta-lactamase class C family)
MMAHRFTSPIGVLALLGALSVALLLGSCSKDLSSGDLSEITGYWRGTPPSQREMGMELVFRVDAAGPDHLEATGYWLLNGSVNNEFPVERAVYRGEEHTLELGYGEVSYVARVDTKLGIARGTFSFPEMEEELLMTRVESATLAELTPRPGMTGAEYVYLRPEELPDGWQTASLEDVGFDESTAAEAVRGVLDGEYGFITSFLVVRDGRLVLEEYFYGSERDDLELTMSVTKSVVSLLVGVAIDERLIESVDVPILTFFPTRRRDAADGWEDVTLEHVLTMSTGAEWPAEAAEGGFLAPTDRFSGVLERPIGASPGSRFDYVGLNVELLSGVIETATGVNADVYAEDALFGPMGVKEYDWSSMKWEGHPLMAGALKLRPRDMARIGQLVLNGGTWDGQRVVSEEWVERSTSTQIEEAPGRGYGYLWWTGTYEFDGRPVDAVFASGLGSNYIMILPEYDMVVVTTGRNVTNGLHQAPLEMMRDHLLPALAAR